MKIKDIEEKSMKIKKVIHEIESNGSGYLNHLFFWETLCPIEEEGGITNQDSEIGKAIEKEYGSFDAFVKIFTTSTLLNLGLGYTYLIYNQKTDALEIRLTDGHDQLFTQFKGETPLMTINVLVDPKLSKSKINK